MMFLHVESTALGRSGLSASCANEGCALYFHFYLLLGHRASTQATTFLTPVLDVGNPLLDQQQIRIALYDATSNSNLADYKLSGLCVLSTALDSIRFSVQPVGGPANYPFRVTDRSQSATCRKWR